MAKAAVDFVALTVRLKCECENWNFGGAVEQRSSLLAAKRRKNAAHGASRGKKWKTEKPQRGERRVTLFAKGKNLRKKPGPRIGPGI